MILRARVKAMADMPPGLPCCEHMRQQLLAFGERTIQVSTSAPARRSHCQACRAFFHGMRVVGFRGWRIDPRCWDIAEAPDA